MLGISMLSKKIICPIIFVFGMILGFILACILFVYSVNNDQKWGDFATWLSALVSIVAFILASLIGMYTYMVSDDQNQNSTLLSLNNLIEERSKRLNEIFSEMEYIFSTAKPDIEHQHDNGVSRTIMHNKLPELQSIILSKSNMIYIIIEYTTLSVRKSKLKNDLKKNMIELFFSLINESVFFEFSNNTEAKAFFALSRPLPSELSKYLDISQKITDSYNARSKI